jgi:hypothetical protein
VTEEMIDEQNRTDAAVTEELPPLPGDPEAGSMLIDGLPFDEGDDEWAAAGPPRGIRLRLPVVALIAVLLVAAGFWGGAVVQKSHGSSGSAGGAAAGLAARLAAGRAGAAGAVATPGGAGNAAGFGGTASQGTTGTVSVVDRSTVYVLTSSGALVTVKLDSSTTVTRNAKAKQDELRPGDSVVVQGATAKNGIVTATSVAATAAGVTSAGGGLRGGFGLGGGTGSTSSGG